MFRPIAITEKMMQQQQQQQQQDGEQATVVEACGAAAASTIAISVPVPHQPLETRLRPGHVPLGLLSCQHVAAILRRCNLAPYVVPFLRNCVDGETLAVSNQTSRERRV